MQVISKFVSRARLEKKLGFTGKINLVNFGHFNFCGKLLLCEKSQLPTAKPVSLLDDFVNYVLFECC